jgi:hypothetical protein
MTGKVEVLEEAGADRATPRRGGGWFPMAVAFIVGLVAGAVFFGPVVAPTVEPTGVGSPTPLAPGEEAGPVGLARAVADFPDALVGIVSTQQSGPEYLLWPLARGPSTRGLPFGTNTRAAIDPSGVWIAALVDLPDGAGALLSVGRSTGVNPVVSGVDSFAWHETAVGSIGFLRSHEGRWGLWQAAAFPSPQLVADLGETHPGSLVAYGSWGWVFQSGPEVVVVADGVEQRHRGQFLDAHDRDLLIAVSGGVMILDDRGARILEHAPVSAGRISPDGTRAALLGDSGLSVVHLAEPSVLVAVERSVPADVVAWSSNSRFVMVPAAPRGVRIIDSATGSSAVHLSSHTFLDLGVIPLSGGS